MKRLLLILLCMVFILSACNVADSKNKDVEKESEEEVISIEYCKTYGDYQYVEVEDLFTQDLVENGLTDFIMYDASELSAERLKNRNSDVVIERCFGVVVSAENGDGRIINPYDKNYDYISYRNVTNQSYTDGTVFLTYFVYNPNNKYIDDIVQRYDFVLSREWEVK